MKISPHNIHPEFKLNGLVYDAKSLKHYSAQGVAEGLDYERAVAVFLHDWFSKDDYIAVHTSGSTGKPKLIELKKEHMVNSALATGSYFKMPPSSKALLCLSATTIAGKMMLVRAMILGWQLDVILPSSSPLKDIENTYDFCAMVPMQLRNSLNHIHKIKTLIVGGASLSKDLRIGLRQHSVAVYETFGMTETASHIALKLVSDGSDKELTDFTDLFETVDGVTVGQDHRGCLVVNAPKISAQKIITNDLVEISSTDAFKWLGRWDNIINSGGVKLIPELIEQKLSSYLSQRFVITSLPDEELGEKLVLAVEGKHNSSDIFDYMKEDGSFNRYEYPKRIFELAAFPETHSGKPDRNKIKELLTG